jgi:hypothetical protein
MPVAICMGWPDVAFFVMGLCGYQGVVGARERRWDGERGDEMDGERFVG